MEELLRGYIRSELSTQVREGIARWLNENPEVELNFRAYIYTKNEKRV